MCKGKGCILLTIDGMKLFWLKDNDESYNPHCRDSV